VGPNHVSSPVGLLSARNAAGDLCELILLLRRKIRASGHDPDRLAIGPAILCRSIAANNSSSSSDSWLESVYLGGSPLLLLRGSPLTLPLVFVVSHCVVVSLWFGGVVASSVVFLFYRTLPAPLAFLRCCYAFPLVAWVLIVCQLSYLILASMASLASLASLASFVVSSFFRALLVP